MRAALAACAGAVAVVTAAAPAGATTYAYWSYWHKTGAATAWTYSNLGPSYYQVSDGGVEGWRFDYGTAGPSDPAPRAAGSYSELCPNNPASAPAYQVALVIDFGSGTPQLDCLTVPKGSTGADVLYLAHVNPKYDSSGLLCSIEGYPPSGCGNVITGSPSPVPLPSSPRSTGPAVPSPATTAPAAPSTAVPRPLATHGAAVRRARPLAAATLSRQPSDPAATASATVSPSATGSLASISPSPAPHGKISTGAVVALIVAFVIAVGAMLRVAPWTRR